MFHLLSVSLCLKGGCGSSTPPYQIPVKLIPVIGNVSSHVVFNVNCVHIGKPSVVVLYYCASSFDYCLIPKYP